MSERVAWSLSQSDEFGLEAYCVDSDHELPTFGGLLFVVAEPGQDFSEVGGAGHLTVFGQSITSASN